MAIHRITPGGQITLASGGALWLPPSYNLEGIAVGRGGIPDVYVQSSTQLYPLSSKLETADGRIFRYCKAGGTIGYTARLVANGFGCAESLTDGFRGYLYSAQAVGDDHVHVLDLATRVENYYQGGFYGYTDAGGQYKTHRIAGSEAAAASDNYCTLYLDEPVKNLLAVSSREVVAEPCMYGSVVGGLTSQQWKSFVCVNMLPITSGYFFWGQTRGPCFLVNYGNGASECGGTINYRQVYGMVTDGSICDQASTPTGYQAVGYVIPVTSAAVGETFIYLQLE